MISAQSLQQQLNGNKNRKMRNSLYTYYLKAIIIIAISFFVVSNSATYAQVQTVIVNKSKITEKVDGKEFFIHPVKKGQTLYYIAKTYEVTIEEIIKENPGLEKGLKADVDIKIPINEFNRPLKEAKKDKKEKKYKNYTVEKGETVYSIAKKFGLKEKDILDINPDLSANLKPGQELKIPADAKIITTTTTTNTKTEVKSGRNLDPKRTYSKHIISKGETLYGVAKKYNLKEKEIIAINPAAETGLRLGDTLYIPNYDVAFNLNEENNKTPIKRDTLKITSNKKEVADNSKNSQDTKNNSGQTHKVGKKETLYSIAGKYAITVDDIRLFNPQIGDAIVPGSIIIIPTTKDIEKLKIEKAKAKHLSDSLVAEAAKPKKKPCDKASTGNTYNVALMMPFYLSDIDKIVVKKGDEETDFSAFKSFTFLDFYEGVLIALDSLKQTGLNVKLFVYDTDEDTNFVKNILRKPELAKMNLIIGPIFNFDMAIVGRFAKAHNIPAIAPLSPDVKILETNSTVYKASPCLAVQMEQVSKFIADSFSTANYIVVYNESDNERTLFDTFKKNLQSNHKNKSVEVKEIIYNQVGLSGLEQALSKDKENIIFVLSNAQVFVSNLVTTISPKTDNFKITMFGLPGWRNFTNIETDYLLKLNLHLFSPNFVNFEDETTIRFIKKFREKYKTEPTKYAYQGYDLAFYFLKALKDYGNDFHPCLSSLDYKPLQTNYKFINSEGNGYENKYVNIYKYKEYKLIKRN